MSALVDTDWLAENISRPDVHLIEVVWDGLEAYEAGHIPGALGWFWKTALWDPFERQFPTDEEFGKRLGAAGIDPSATVVIYGTPVQFGTYAWWVLKMFGHADVRILDGGKEKWASEGRPLSTDIPTPTACTYTVTGRDEASRAGRDDVLAALDRKDVTLFDNRSFEEYSGQRVGLPGKPDVGAERYGRIPGAVHVPFDGLLNDDTTFKSPDQLAEIIGAHVTDPNAEIIAYCRLSHRATLARFAMTELLGFTNVRVYDGSWTEWGSMVGMPIER